MMTMITVTRATLYMTSDVEETVYYGVNRMGSGARLPEFKPQFWHIIPV